MALTKSDKEDIRRIVDETIVATTHHLLVEDEGDGDDVFDYLRRIQLAVHA